MNKKQIQIKESDDNGAIYTYIDININARFFELACTL